MLQATEPGVSINDLMKTLKPKVSEFKSSLKKKQTALETILVPKLAEAGIKDMKIVTGKVIPIREFKGGDHAWVDCGDLIFDIFGDEYGLGLITDKDFSAEITGRYKKSGDKLASYTEEVKPSTKTETPKPTITKPKKSIDAWLSKVTQ